MQEAGLINFMKTILIIITIYYVLKIIGRLVFPLFLKKMMQKVEKKFNEQQQHQTNSNQTTMKEGETIVDKAPDTHSKSNKSVGEYVDYEDIE
ncbi:MAG TPA: DUF4834 domain-containing protein [Flavobacteriaceae bacterium]|jgi:hypothetical protein|nr:DUF4834 domain-containing protein [Flavobacteriaceae bacterium]HBS12427.1 DUF4834 domain-containing protein [Flavobacteriaceae bacterium]